jgi:hypothetical protein
MSLPRRTLLATALGLAGYGTAEALTRTPSWPAGFDVPICRADFAIRGPADADADLLEKLGLLEGHLVVGRRLMEAGEARLAVPHFGHPIRELYTYLEPRLRSRGLPQMERELDVMEAHAEAGRTNVDGAFGGAWDALMPKLRAAQASVPATKRQSDRFMLGHVALMLYTVASDYGESIERGRIVNIVEYHDSMGFLAYARRAAEAGRGPLWDEARAELATLEQEAYPRLLPNPRPNISISAVRARSSRIQAIADRAQA